MILTRPIDLSTVTYSVRYGTALNSLDALQDPNPGERVRVAWPASSDLAIRMVFASSLVRVAAAIRGLRGVPEGIRVALFTVASSTNYPDTAAATRYPGGDMGVTFLPNALAGSQAVTFVQMHIQNIIHATGDSAGMTPGDEVEIGLFHAAAAVEFEAEGDWTLGNKTGSRMRRTYGAQANIQRRKPYQVLTAKPVSTDAASARAGGLDGTDWRMLAADLHANPYTLAVVRTDDPQATSIYGVATQVPDIQHRAGPCYQPSQLVIEEVPG